MFPPEHCSKIESRTPNYDYNILINHFLEFNTTVKKLARTTSGFKCTTTYILNDLFIKPVSGSCHDLIIICKSSTYHKSFVVTKMFTPLPLPKFTSVFKP